MAGYLLNLLVSYVVVESSFTSSLIPVPHCGDTVLLLTLIIAMCHVNMSSVMKAHRSAPSYFCVEANGKPPCQGWHVQL
jgi:hypothetical protein